MKLAATQAIAELAQQEQSDVVAMAYGDANLSFGPEYLIPKPFDPRLIVKIAPAVAKAAMDSGVATRPIADLNAYREQLIQFVYHSGLIMKPVFDAAKKKPKRVVYCEGEDQRVLHAVQVGGGRGHRARPIVIGRPEVVNPRLEKLGLRVRPGKDFELVNPNSDPRFPDYWQLYYDLMQRKGVSVEVAKREVIRRTTLIGALMVKQGDADAMICGTYGEHSTHLAYIANVIGLKPGVKQFAAMNLLLLQERTLFICDTYVNPDPTAEELAEITLLAAEEVQRFGLTPKIALLSHSNFGSARTSSAQKMSRMRELLEQARAASGGGGRDARRCRAVGRDPPADVPQLAAQGRGQPADHAHSGRGQHLLQSAEGHRRRRHHRRPDPASARRRPATSSRRRRRCGGWST